MTFDEWWEKTLADNDLSPMTIKDEIKWFSERAWYAGVGATIEQEREQERERA